MLFGLPVKRRGLPTWVPVAALLLTIPVVIVIVTTVDAAVMGTAWRAVRDRPLGLVAALAAFGAAFMLRAYAWIRVLPDLKLGHGWAGLHLALGGNHVLPLRLGEPLRIASVVRRAGIDWGRATASTVTLRAADLFAIGLIGVLAGTGAFSAWWTAALVVGGGGAMVVFGLAWLWRLRRSGRVVMPGPVAIGATLGAWLLESVVVHQAAGWAGVDVSFRGAVLVTAAAVIAQIAAFAPGGIGTYEAGGVAALAFLGVEPAAGLAVVITAHAAKTLYSLVGGAVALFVPSPGMLGRLRLGPSVQGGIGPPVADDFRPVVLFMPAYNEEASVGSVVRRVPPKVSGRGVVCLVVDDGSTDATSAAARAAGAVVVELRRNRGLGAAVREGLGRAMEHDPAAIAFCDADGEYAPEELDRMVAPILSGEADYVVGSRFAGDIERMLPHRRFGNRVLTWILSWVARRRISDGQSGYRAFSPRAAEAAEVIHDFNYAQVITLDLLAKGMRYVEVPISYSFRTTGESFVKLGRYLRAVVPAVYREVNT